MSSGPAGLLCLLCLGHLSLSARAHPEAPPPPPSAQLPAAAAALLRAKRSGPNGGAASSSASAPSAQLAPSWAVQGSGSDTGSFQWSPSGRRTGSLYCRVGIGFHLQIHPDGNVNGSHQASLLSKSPSLLSSPPNPPGTGLGASCPRQALGPSFGLHRYVREGGGCFWEPAWAHLSCLCDVCDFFFSFCNGAPGPDPWGLPSWQLPRPLKENPLTTEEEALGF